MVMVVAHNAANGHASKKLRRTRRESARGPLALHHWASTFCGEA
jgi:hypothetical protein